MSIAAKMKEKLETVGIPKESIDVFGSIRCNVHVKCKSHDSARKWADLLGKLFIGSKVYVGKTAWYAKENKGTVLKPSMIKGYMVAVAG